jgi:hypothetical protein
MRRLLNRRTRTGQSVLEYVLVLTAVMAGILLAAVNIKAKVRDSLGGVQGSAGTESDQSVMGKMKNTVVTNFNF